MFSRNLKFKAIWSTVLTLTLLVAPFAVQANGPAAGAPLLKTEGANIIPDEYIVVFKSNVAVINAEASIRSSVAAMGGKVNFVYGAALNGYSAKLSAQALAAVRADPNVAYVEADAIMTLEPDPEALNPEVIHQPVDSGTWGPDRIDQNNLPLSHTYNYVKTGAGVHAYIIDTGIRATHHEFGGRASKDYNAVPGGGDATDCYGHGTHVAGIVGGKTYGVAKAVRIHAVRVFGCSGGSPYSVIIAGVNWVTAHRILPAVANLSLGGPISASLDSAINNLINHGVVVVVSAGNSSANACNYSPAHVAAAITVGSTYHNSEVPRDERSWFSNIGVCLDIFAPGSFVKSAWYNGDFAVQTLSGTSMASPHVAGVAALYLQGHPSASPATVRAFLVTNSTLNKVFDRGVNSPNRLLFSRFSGN